MINPNQAELDFTLQRLANYTSAAEGSVLPPSLRGSLRIPLVRNLRIIKRLTFAGGTQFTLVWDEPAEVLRFLSHFNVYVFGLLSDNKQPIGPYSVRRSPAEVRVVSSEERPVIFIVQTVLKNGQMSDLEF